MKQRISYPISSYDLLAMQLSYRNHFKISNQSFCLRSTRIQFWAVSVTPRTAELWLMIYDNEISLSNQYIVYGYGNFLMISLASCFLAASNLSLASVSLCRFSLFSIVRVLSISSLTVCQRVRLGNPHFFMASTKVERAFSICWHQFNTCSALSSSNPQCLHLVVLEPLSRCLVYNSALSGDALALS